MSDYVFSVEELAVVLAEMLQSPNLRSLALRGEVQSLAVKDRYTFITLIDENASAAFGAAMRVVVGNSCQVLSPDYKVGDILILKGNISYHKQRGTVSFWPRTLEVEGRGGELLRLRILKEKLQKEGLFAPEHKRPLPRYPRGVAVVTSASGAAIEDIRTALQKRWPTKLKIYDATVQGERAVESLVSALESAYRDPEVDLLIISRGGGSKSDLSAFDDEKVARILFRSPIPVISAVGHQIDTSICDLVADQVAITPTDAASYVGCSLEELHALIAETQRALRRELQRVINSKSSTLQNCVLLLAALAPSARIKHGLAAVSAARQELNLLLKSALTAAGGRLLALKQLLDSGAPQQILRRGFALVSRSGKTLTRASEAQPGEVVEIKWTDGVRTAEIK